MDDEAAPDGSPTRHPPGEGDRGQPYPVGLLLRGRRVVVVGGGQVAQRRVASLLTVGAEITVVSPQVRPALEGQVGSGEITWERRPYQTGDLAGAWYAVAATDDPTVNAAVLAEAESERIFAVRADDATLGTAWTPAVGRHGRVTVAVLSDRDPLRSARLRDEIVERLGDGRDVDPPQDPDRGEVVLVGGGPGDPDLLTLAGRRALASADVVVADRLAPRALLAELPPHVELVDATKLPRGRALGQDDINALLVEHARAGRRVVRFKGGDPFVFGRGYEEVLACANAGVRCRVVPGVTSAVAVPALAGVPVTHRGVAQEFTVVSGHLPPGHPESLVNWQAVAGLRGTLVLLMAVDSMPAIASVLVDHGRPADTPVVVVQEGTMPREQRVTTTLGSVAADMASAGVRPPAVIVVGGAAGVVAGG